MKEEKVIIAVEMDANKKLQVRINTTNEPLLALALLTAQGDCIKFINRTMVENGELVKDVVMSVEFDEHKNIKVYINTNNKALVATSLRKAQQCVDFYLQEEAVREFKKELESKIVQAPNLVSVPSSVLERLG